MNDNHYDFMAEAAEAMHEAVEALKKTLAEIVIAPFESLFEALQQIVDEHELKSIETEKERCCWKSCTYRYNVHERPRDARPKTHNIRNHTRRR